MVPDTYICVIQGEEFIKEERRLHHDDRKEALSATAEIDHTDKSFREYLGKLNLLKVS
jgi:hypothetical protein